MARPLKMFMRGKSVRMLQETLKRLGYPMEDQPGIFGASSRDAVKNFQSQNGLKVTGIADDGVLKLMRQGHNVADIDAAQSSGKSIANRATASIDQGKLESLIHLLISKGLITEAELAEEMADEPAKAQPKKPSRLPMG